MPCAVRGAGPGGAGQDRGLGLDGLARPAVPEYVEQGKQGVVFGIGHHCCLL